MSPDDDGSSVDDSQAHQQGAVSDAQRRLLLVLRSQHGPAMPAVWAQASSRAKVVGTGELSLTELQRVAEVLAEDGGPTSVAARTCLVRLLFLRPRAEAGLSAPRPRPVRPPGVAGLAAPQAPAPGALRDEDVQRAFREPDALDPSAWLSRLAELESDLADSPR